MRRCILKRSNTIDVYIDTGIVYILKRFNELSGKSNVHKNRLLVVRREIVVHKTYKLITIRVLNLFQILNNLTSRK